MTQSDNDHESIGNPLDDMSPAEAVAHKLEANALFLQAMASGEFKLVREDVMGIARDILEAAKALRRQWE